MEYTVNLLTEPWVVCPAKQCGAYHKVVVTHEYEQDGALDLLHGVFECPKMLSGHEREVKPWHTIEWVQPCP